MSKPVSASVGQTAPAACNACGQPLPHGCQTYEQVMDEYYAAEMERYYNPPPLPVAPPRGWDWDLWQEFRLGVMAERSAE